MKQFVKQAGFTLLEIMVALVLLSLITTLLFSSFSNIFLAVEQTSADANVLRQARQVLSRLSREISMAYLSQTNLLLAGGQAPISTATWGFIGKGSGGSTRLDFTSVAHTKFYKDFNESDQCELSYYLKPDRKSKGRYRLVRRLDTTVDDDIEEGGREYTIAESIQELNFRYYDHTKDEWIEEWDTTRMDQSNRLPYAVEISVIFIDPDENERSFVTRTKVRMAKIQEER